MPQSQDDEDRIRQQLLEAGRDLIRQRGAVEIPLGDIAAACGLSTNNFNRYFADKDAYYEAMAGEWFAELQEIMDEVVGSELPPREKLYQFIARRMKIVRTRYQQDPDYYASLMEIGNQHWEAVRGYIELADHYMAGILSEAMAEGYFAGLELDHTISLVNLMVQPFVNGSLMIDMHRLLSEENLQIVIDAIFTGLRKNAQNDDTGLSPNLSIVE